MAAAAASSSSGPITKAASAQEPPIIGFEKDKAKIIDAMLDPNHPELSFIAITGERGVGKTTLAKEIYASAEVQQGFDVNIWLFGLDDNALKEMRMQTIGTDSHSRLKGTGDRQSEPASRISEEVREYLNVRKYCLVIDNCWIDRDNMEMEIGWGVPDNNKGSRVLICSFNYYTEIPQVLRVQKKKVLMNHVVGYRSEEESLEILIRAANLNLNSRTPTTNTMQEMLDLIRHSFLPLCNGLPWPLRFMGSFLSMLPPNLHSWTHLLRTITRKYPETDDFVWESAMISRMSSFSERAAFLSFLTYPPDAHIPAHALLRKWTASRIARDGAHANRMLQYFVGRSIVQVEERPINGRLVKVCQMVDPLVRALAVQEAREKRYVRVCSNHQGATICTCMFQEAREKRYMHVCSNHKRVIYGDIFSPEVFVDNHMVKKGDNFNAEKIDVTQLVDSTCGIFNWSSETKTMLSWSRVLEVNSSQNIRDVERALMEMERLDHLETLVVEGTPLETLPPGLLRENMPLKHLILSDTKLQEIPLSILNLKKLETLEVSGSPLETLPPGLLRENMPLKHLILSDTKLQEIPLSIQNLKWLETLEVSGAPLETLPPGLWSQGIPLKHLILSDTKLQEIPLSIQNLKMLETLNVSGAPIKFLPEFIGNLKHLRTLDVSGTFLDTIPKFFRKLKYLKTLDISSTSIDSIVELISLETLNVSGTPIRNLPEFMSELTWLKTLDISGTLIDTIPEVIGKLTSLETLDIRDTFIRFIPYSVWNLRRLRSVLASDSLEHLDGPPNSLQYSNLETLTIVHVSETWKENAVPKLPSLRELGLSSYNRAKLLSNNWHPAFNLLGTLENLSSLKLQGSHIPARIIHVDICPSYSETLTELWVGGSQSLFSLHDITMPPCLTNLTLENLEFEEDPMPVLGKLEELKILRLRLLLDAAPAARKMTCSSNLFPCLEKLELYHLTGLEKWSIEEGAVPKLTHVLIRNCKALKAVPKPLLQRETPLQELHLHSMPSAFTVDITQSPFVKITNNRN